MIELLHAALLSLATVPAAGTVEPAPSAAVPRAARDAVRVLRDWTKRAARAADGLDEREVALVRELLERARAEVADRPDDGEARRELDLALLDLAALPRTESDHRSEQGRAALRALADLGRSALEGRLERDAEGVAGWLAADVLRDDGQPLERRLEAAALLEGRYVLSSRASLLRTAHAAEGEVRDAALAALAGWEDPMVHEFFLDRLGEEGYGLWALSRHLERAGPTMGRRALDRVRDLAGRLLLGEDWRQAARARSLIRTLDAQRAVPVLMEALRWWARLDGEERGSTRILWEVVEELQRLSGRSLGPDPEAWGRWWDAVQEGRIELPGEGEEGPEPVTSATFFGLSPRTDRVVFVVDRSASMESVFGTGGSSRYDEAVDQLLRFLRAAGSRTRFAVVLFSDESERWRGGLVRASDANVERVAEWLSDEDPLGGTELFEGIALALRLDRDGELDPGRVDVDTVVVLCDGATAEGPGWVEPWLARENDAAQLVFHCVQIGDEGDGSLEALAAGTGGDFLRVRR